MAQKQFFNLSDEKDLEEVINLLQNDELDAEMSSAVNEAAELEFVLVPPEDGADSDKDDAESDAEGEPLISHLGKGVLGSQQAEVRIVKKVNKNICENKDLNLSVKKTKSLKVRKIRDWKEVPLNREGPQFENPEISNLNILKTISENKMAPVDFFRELFNDDIIDHLCRETVKYAAHKGFHIILSHEDIYKYIAILLLSGYTKVMHRRQYWETRADTNNAAVTNAMSRNHFDTIHRFFHVNDNTKKSEDKLFKVQPLLDHLNKKFQEMAEPLGTRYSLDEAMEPYYGRNSMKQFIKGKPIRYGYKLWCLANFNGYLLKFLPYTGKGCKEPGKTLGSSITEKLCSNYIPEGGTIYLDNYFCTLSLLESLHDLNIGCVAVIRRDRIEKAPLPELKKKPKGTTAALRDSNSCISLIGWNDNNEVIMATNLESEEVLCLQECRRWNTIKKKKISTPQPAIIKEYNRYMGGVDLFDNLRSLYRIRIRSKKWYWPFVRFCINGGIVNQWILYREYDSIPLLEFQRRIVLALLSAPNIEKPRGVKPRSSQVAAEVRFDRIDHLVQETATQRRCAQCGKCAKFRCVKCDVALHPKFCFLKYHTH